MLVTIFSQKKLIDVSIITGALETGLRKWFAVAYMAIDDAIETSLYTITIHCFICILVSIIFPWVFFFTLIILILYFILYNAFSIKIIFIIYTINHIIKKMTVDKYKTECIFHISTSWKDEDLLNFLLFWGNDGQESPWDPYRKQFKMAKLLQITIFLNSKDIYLIILGQRK